MMSRKLPKLLAGASAFALLAACGNGGDSDTDGEAISIDFAHLYETTHSYHTCAAVPLQETLASNGSNIELEIFPAGQLGGEQQLIQSVESGDIGMTTGGPSALANWHSPWGVLDAAFAVDDWDHMERIWDSDIRDDLTDGLVENGNMRPLALWYYGTRHVTSNVEVRTPEDLSGQKMRAIDTPESLENMRVLGADPVPVAYSELYLALQQGTVDGQENPLPTIDSLNLYEVQTTLSMTGHLVQSTGLVMNEDLYNGLSDEQKELLDEAISEVSQSLTECTEAREAELLEEWQGEGGFDVVVTADEIDRAAFVERGVEALPSKFGDKWGADMYDRLRELAE